MSSFPKKFKRFGMVKLLMLIHELEPSVVVFTFLHTAGALSILKSDKLTKVPAFTVSTDHTDHTG
ncbi:hypothetical protein G9U52_28110 [Paenibacillus sp. S3N08]|uniref:Diacylglycerol glucosyltransferase N-terminal domain-containing protein n=1 Tax=Paenibacillus agricola TaxID=2716264 RepID=A0ABX0JE58_9BACL|nr:hypothetical protein [Paenibacillus agricola]